jgi:uncharacterized membrane protein
VPPIARKDEQRRFVLLALLFLFLVARILQLFAGRVPNLLIVTFHVIPPALFAVVHGARIYRSRGILIFISLCLGVGTFFESLSLRTGFPFGYYRFTDLMGPKLFDLPILLALAYVGMGYLSWVLAAVILDCQNGPLSGRNIVLLPLAASFVMTAWDFSMDAVWADIDHAWVWRNGGSYYGVPTSNFFGWFLTVYIFYQLFALYLRNRVVVAPPSMGGHFVDAAGKQWAIPGILWASRFVSILLMMPLSLIAWIKASGPVKPLSKQVPLGNGQP